MVSRRTSGEPGRENSLAAMETLSERVAYALEQRRMSQQALENEARLSRGYISRVSRGERTKLSPEMLRRIADGLRVSYEWLATGRGAMDDLEAELPAAGGSVRAPDPRMQALEAAVAYHGNKWSAPAVAAARAMATAPDAEELHPPEWAEVLDQIEAALSKVTLKKRR